MTDLRKKSADIKAAGVAERGNFEPTGAPKRLYNYWLKHTNSKKGRAIACGSRRENFCHFWRVVVLWAPLMGLKRAGSRVIDHPVTWVITALAGVAGLIYLFVTVDDAWVAALTFLGIIAAAVVSILLGFGVSYLIDKFWNENWNEALAITLVSAFGLLAVGAGVYGLVEWAQATSVWLVLGAVVGTIAVGALAIFGGSKLSDHIAGKRALRKAEEEARRNAYYNGEITLEEYKGSPRVPGKFEVALGKFFSGVGDFVILIGQIVRVKKWKICPLVEVDNGR